jgi:hypothetical protein
VQPCQGDQRFQRLDYGAVNPHRGGVMLSTVHDAMARADQAVLAEMKFQPVEEKGEARHRAGGACRRFFGDGAAVLAPCLQHGCAADFFDLAAQNGAGFRSGIGRKNRKLDAG